MLWGDIKLATLKKIDPSIQDLAPTRNTKDYINAMVETANRGLQDLSTAGKFITKKIIITQNPIKNILPMPLYLQDIFQHDARDTSYEANGATSYYFEVDGTATIEIEVDGVVVKTIENTAKGLFTPHKGFIPNPLKKTVKIVFKGSYPYMYSNIALYDVTFESEEEIWPFVSEKRYDMKELTNDFYKLVTTDLVFQSGFSKTRYKKTEDYYWEGDSVLVLNGHERGSWIVHYYSYPKGITKSTPDNDEIGLDPEVASLLPIYMAAELFEDENISTATLWRNQYEEMKSQLSPTQEYGRTSVFVDTQGW